MKRKNDSFPSIKKDESPIIPQRSKLRNPLTIYQRQDLTDKQKAFLEIALDKKTKLMFVCGPAGTSKTWLSIYSALILMSEKRVSDLIYVRSIVESADNKMGYLPGEASSKIEPYMQPLFDKLGELLPRNDIDLLKKEERISGMPVGFMRGASWNAKVIIFDEMQNASVREIHTFLTRIGEFCRCFALFDPEQSDINGKSGALKICNIFDDEESRENGIRVFRFDDNDNVRSGLSRFINKKLKKSL